MGKNHMNIVGKINGRDVFMDDEIQREIQDIKKAHMASIFSLTKGYNIDFYEIIERKNLQFKKDITLFLIDYIETGVMGGYLRKNHLVNIRSLEDSIGKKYEELLLNEGQDVAMDFKLGTYNKDGSLKYRVLKSKYKEVFLDYLSISENLVEDYIVLNKNQLPKYFYHHLSFPSKKAANQVYNQAVGSSEKFFIQNTLDNVGDNKTFLQTIGPYTYRFNSFLKAELDLNPQIALHEHLKALELSIRNLRPGEMTKPFILKEDERIPGDYKYNIVELVNIKEYTTEDIELKTYLRQFLKDNKGLNNLDLLMNSLSIEVYIEDIKDLYWEFQNMLEDNTIIAKANGQDIYLKTDRVLLNLIKETFEKYYYLKSPLLKKLGMSDQKIKNKLTKLNRDFTKKTILKNLFFDFLVRQPNRDYYQFFSFEDQIKNEFPTSDKNIREYIKDNKDSLLFLEIELIYFSSLRDADAAYEFLCKNDYASLSPRKFFKSYHVNKIESLSFFKDKKPLKNYVSNFYSGLEDVVEEFTSLEKGALTGPIRNKLRIVEPYPFKLAYIETAIENPYENFEAIKELIKNEYLREVYDDFYENMTLEIYFENIEKPDYNASPSSSSDVLFFHNIL